MQLKLLVLIFFSISCSSLSRPKVDLTTKPKLVASTNAVVLKLNPNLNEKIEHKYRVVSLTTTFDDSTVAREKEEVTEFEARQIIRKKNDKAISIDMTTHNKKGPTDLRDLIMPKEGEVLSLHLSPNGSVQYAEGFETDSAFYLSPISLPDKAVKVGDTWDLKEEWKNDKTGMPMEIELVSILKNIYELNGRKYADIETSGEVTVPILLRQKIDFKSTIIGRILLDISSGNVVWSEVRNEEDLKYPQTRVHIRSCMELKLKKPSSLIWPWATEPACNPAEEFVYAIPGN